jgi:hypothetical protein
VVGNELMKNHYLVYCGEEALIINKRVHHGDLCTGDYCIHFISMAVFLPITVCMSSSGITALMGHRIRRPLGGGFNFLKDCINF